MRADERILGAANELFFRHGIKSITMDEIASHCGMSKRTIYGSYDDKDAIVNAMTKQELALQDHELTDIRKRSENAIDEMMLAMNCIRKIFGTTGINSQ